ncbi:hypothetical protein [Bacillus sp. ISL-7]|nr:hypothetical protein [Bacillus sp. ISL-7]MBT2738883.1 hypothetical protein [Bacillus sp. ISL-7]
MAKNRNHTQETKQITSEETVIENTNAEQDEAIKETANETAREVGKEV